MVNEASAREVLRVHGEARDVAVLGGEDLGVREIEPRLREGGLGGGEASLRELGVLRTRTNSSVASTSITVAGNNA